MKWLITLVITSALFLTSAEQAQARRQASKGGREFRFRPGFLYGRVDYNSASYSTNAVTTFDGYQYGTRSDLEFWFNPRLGAMLEGMYMNAQLLGNSTRFRGKPIYHVWGAANFGLRLAGTGGAMNSEFVTFVGPALESFSDVRAYRGQTFYDLKRPQIFGLKAGFRWRWAFAKDQIFELGGFWITPLLLQTNGTGDTLTKGATRSFGTLVSYEKCMSDGINLGVGFNYEKHRLQYKLGGAPGPQVIDFNLTTGILFIRLWI